MRVEVYWSWVTFGPSEVLLIVRRGKTSDYGGVYTPAVSMNCIWAWNQVMYSRPLNSWGSIKKI